MLRSIFQWRPLGPGTKSLGEMTYIASFAAVPVLVVAAILVVAVWAVVS